MTSSTSCAAEPCCLLDEGPRSSGGSSLADRPGTSWARRVARGERIVHDLAEAGAVHREVVVPIDVEITMYNEHRGERENVT